MSNIEPKLLHTPIEKVAEEIPEIIIAKVPMEIDTEFSQYLNSAYKDDPI